MFFALKVCGCSSVAPNPVDDISHDCTDEQGYSKNQTSATLEHDGTAADGYPTSVDSISIGEEDFVQAPNNVSGNADFMFLCNIVYKQLMQNIYAVKGGESSSQFRWFTIAKIEH